MSSRRAPETACVLIKGLLLEAGRLREDESAELGLAAPGVGALLAAWVGRLQRVAGDLLALAAAAQVLASTRQTGPVAPDPASDRCPSINLRQP